MKVNAIRLGIATALGLAVIWILCVVLVWLLPGMTMAVFADMMHGKASEMVMGWHLTLSGFFVGMFAWSVCGGITAWLIGTIYNKMSSNDA
ncbi:hypothetical protein KS2013_1138 [Kangiella sediminilitoris]|uniref:Uncharacterized protein n=2 Tax=Kangiella sediminilitoris TaxID=1144748 RepID=A0A1B3BAM9_9GAMM|nr:hypothetical protein KS2013_1138 [Kangiella sediminilitoris]